MEIKTKHRIIGIIAIVALAIIILPFFINRSQNAGTSMKTATQVPLADSSEAAHPAQKPTLTPTQSAIEPSMEMTSTANEPHNSVPIEPQQIPSNSNLATEPLQPIAQTAKKEVVATSIKQPKTSEAENTTADSPAKAITKPAPTHEENTKPKKIPRNKNGSVKMMFAHAQHHNVILAKKELKKEVKKNLENAWTVQIGSFAQKNNANKLVQQLRKKGFAAYIDRAKSGNVTVDRVFVGPEAKRAHAEQLVRKIKQAFQLKGVVVKYKV